ncbi:MAG: hypothetical protein FJZ47_14255 [Candidatus Tectomicrobia bacterium]|uniref:Uncharacterized protein n=1 Tax=Tectimicrobiota bacterium TaxID=2528274 RepID=A0A937W3Y0_UNCTE|nr:hypothetical protein [Candidatus Tectomicrobia bacterium]
MRQWWWVLALMCVRLLSHAGAVSAAPTGQYIAEGVSALVQYDYAAARERALQNAFREALEDAVGDMTEPRALTRSLQSLRTRLYTKPLQYIVSYRVLWEYPDPPQKVYRVGIEAEILVQDVSRVVDSLGITRRQDARRLAIFMAERYPGQTSQTFAASRGIVAEVLRRELQAQGVRVLALDPGRLWDGQETSALAVSKQLEVKIVLVGWAQVQLAPYEAARAPGGAMQAIVDVKALATDGSGQIAQAQVDAVVPFTEREQGEVQALSQAAIDVAARLLPALTAYRSGR